MTHGWRINVLYSKSYQSNHKPSPISYEMKGSFGLSYFKCFIPFEHKCNNINLSLAVSEYYYVSSNKPLKSKSLSWTLYIPIDYLRYLQSRWLGVVFFGKTELDIYYLQINQLSLLQDTEEIIGDFYTQSLDSLLGTFYKLI